HHTTVFTMHGNLAVQGMGQQALFRTDQRHAGFIAGTFKSKNIHGTYFSLLYWGKQEFIPSLKPADSIGVVPIHRIKGGDAVAHSWLKSRIDTLTLRSPNNHKEAAHV